MEEVQEIDPKDKCAAWGCDNPQVKPYPACAEHLQNYLEHPGRVGTGTKFARVAQMDRAQDSGS
jgi:hypothetical protein